MIKNFIVNLFYTKAPKRLLRHLAVLATNKATRLEHEYYTKITWVGPRSEKFVEDPEELDWLYTQSVLWDQRARRLRKAAQ